MKKKGMLVTIEGIDGSGKSLLAKNLYNELKNKQIPVILTQEPGATNLGKKLRKILHEEKENVCDLAEYLLFAADRAQHFENTIIPSLKHGNIIISDRMGDSSVAYQGYGRGLNVDKIKLVNAWAMRNMEPDIIFYINIDIQTALERVFNRNKNLTSFEKEKIEFWKKVINGYNESFKNKNNVFYLEGKQSPNELKNIALNIILKKHE